MGKLVKTPNLKREKKKRRQDEADTEAGLGYPCLLEGRGCDAGALGLRDVVMEGAKMVCSTYRLREGLSKMIPLSITLRQRQQVSPAVQLDPDGKIGSKREHGGTIVDDLPRLPAPLVMKFNNLENVDDFAAYESGAQAVVHMSAVGLMETVAKHINDGYAELSLVEIIFATGLST